MSKKPVKLTIGRHTYGQPIIHRFAACEVTIGSFCSIGGSVVAILSGTHDYRKFSTFPFARRAGWPVDDGQRPKPSRLRIGSDVWIGWGATLFAVNIGHGAVIGTNAMVTKDVEPYAIVAGNPAKVIGYRFPEETRKELLKLAWWDWSDEEIQERFSELQEAIL